MPAYFRCDYCNEERSLGQFQMVDDFHRECAHCGQDICVGCEMTGLCDGCYDATPEEDEDDEEATD